MYGRFSRIRQLAPTCTPSSDPIGNRTVTVLPPAKTLWVRRPQDMSWVGRGKLSLHVCFIGPTVCNGISIGSGLTIVTDRATDRPRYSVCSNRPRLHSTAMRTNNNRAWHRGAVEQRV